MRRLVHLLRPFTDVNGRRWHHPSVSALMHLSQAGECPESLIDRLCCELVAEAKAFGWSGPPFDPEILASLEGISVETVAQEIGADARIFPTEDGHLLIQCISSVSAERRRFSIAHEIVHTRFPDYYERVRYRSEGGQDRAYSELEQLCNAGAAEILMPKEDIMLHLANRDVSAEVAEGLRKQFGVSREAMLRRLCNLSEDACAVVVMSLRLKPSEERDGGGLFPGFVGPQPKLRVEYVYASRSFPCHIPKHKSAPNDSVVYHTAGPHHFPTAIENWRVRNTNSWKVQSILLSPVPGERDRRVAALIKWI